MIEKQPLNQQAMEPEGSSGITGSLQISAAFAQKAAAEASTLAALKNRLESLQDGETTPLLNTLLLSALALDASDIHIEPEKESTKVRFRVDGILHDVAILHGKGAQKAVSRLKLLAKIKLNISDTPQDGRFSFTVAGQSPIEVRVATIPSEYGESMVLRVLNPQNLIALDALGLRKDLYSLFADAIIKPHGMILATGPTGSGKTTTLYAFLKEIQKPEIKIVTIEDPIEYHLAGISQTQVKSSATTQATEKMSSRRKGYDFSTGLQAIMRQDPDVILVGEIRDKATAQIALQAALTGHLVLSTLHTNDAPGTVSRLFSLGAEPMNVAAGITLVIGQRLARKVCSQCSIKEQATAEELRQITQEVEEMKPEIRPQIPKPLMLARVKGCDNCGGIGYKGRTGIFEAILVEDEMEEHILSSPSISALRKFAIQKGMVPMYHDGLLKILQGITTMEEVNRVAAE